MSTQIAKLVARIAENLPDMSGPQVQGWIENPKRLQQALKVLAEIPSDPKVWKRITLGTGIDADGYRKAIKAKKMRIGDYANDILGKPTFSVATEEEEVELDLVVVSVAELGFPKGAKLKDIFARAKEKGLHLCPNQVGPELRLQYEDQPKDEWLLIGMEPITGSGGGPSVFRVGHDSDDLWRGAMTTRAASGARAAGSCSSSRASNFRLLLVSWTLRPSSDTWFLETQREQTPQCKRILQRGVFFYFQYDRI